MEAEDSVLTRIYRPKGNNNISWPHPSYCNYQYQILVACAQCTTVNKIFYEVHCWPCFIFQSPHRF